MLKKVVIDPWTRNLPKVSYRNKCTTEKTTRQMNKWSVDKISNISIQNINILSQGLRLTRP